MFKIHVGECSGTRSNVNSNSAFMPVSVCFCVYVCVGIGMGKKIPSTAHVRCTYLFCSEMSRRFE